jgi:anti-anti-sigma factor
MGFVDEALEFRLTVARLAPRKHVATIAGELELSRAPELRARLWPLAETPGTAVVVDLRDAPFIDSTALGALTGLAQRLHAGGGELVLASDDPRLHRLLEVTGLLSILPIETTLARAVERVGCGTSV